MNTMERNRDIVLEKMRERAKELNCLYAVIELLSGNEEPIDRVLGELVTLIPMGWQHRTVCEALIVYEGKEYFTEDLKKTQWYQKADIVIDENYAGEVRVYYTLNIHDQDDPFLPEEQRLLNNIASRIGQFIFHRKLRKTVEYMQKNRPVASTAGNESLLSYSSDEHWRWRQQMLEQLAASTDLKKYGIRAMYVIGSTKDASAGPGSDIDLLVHFMGNEEQKCMLKTYMEGWGRCLGFMNYRRTGYKTEGSLIDLHIVTDEDIRKKDSYAAMIGSSENSARLLKSDGQ